MLTDCTCDLCQFDATCESCGKPLCRDSISNRPVVDVRGKLSCVWCAAALDSIVNRHSGDKVRR